jgi:glutaredoxin
VDHIPCLKAWAESLGGINYPLLSDFWPHGVVAEKYGVLRSDGKSERALFIIDKEGIIRYIDIHNIDTQPDNEELRRALRKIDPEAAARADAQVKPVEQPLPHGGIVMYCSSWCPDCKRARAWLKAHNLPYTEVDIYANDAAGAQVRKWANGNMTTPTFEIDGTVIVEFDEEKLKKALKVK